MDRGKLGTDCPVDRVLGLIRLCGHLPKSGYEVPTACALKSSIEPPAQTPGFLEVSAIERGIPKKSRGLLREAQAVKFPWIAAEKALCRAHELCRVRDVTRSGFYAWEHWPESVRTRRDW